MKKLFLAVVFLALTALPCLDGEGAAIPGARPL